MEQNLFSIIGLLKQVKIREMQKRNTEILHSSSEYAYWQEKLNEDYDCKQYKRFKKVKNDHKRLCPNRDDYKSHSKWYGEVGQYYTYKDHLYHIAGNVRKSAMNNRIYCPASRKNKVLFESEKAADNFIKYNADDIREQNGYAPIRSYYCPICGGWHVTSRPDEFVFKDHMSHAEYVLKVLNNMSDNTIIPEGNYEKLQNLHNMFLHNYKSTDLDKMIEIYEEMIELTNRESFDETEEEKVEYIMNSCRNVVLKLAIMKNDLSDLDKYKCLEKDDYIKLSMFANVRRLMNAFDFEIANGGIEKCKEIYNAISEIKDIDFYPLAQKRIKRFLEWADGAIQQAIEETLEMKKYLANCIDNYISAYNNGDDETCLKIKLELVSCDVNRLDTSTQNSFSNAINLMGGDLSAAC